MKVTIQKLTEYKKIPKRKIKEKSGITNKKNSTSNSQNKPEIAILPNTTFQQKSSISHSFFYKNPIKVKIKSIDINDHSKNISPNHSQNLIKNYSSLHKNAPKSNLPKNKENSSSIFLMKNCNYNKIYNININDSISKKMNNKRKSEKSSLHLYTYIKPKTTSAFTRYKNFNKEKSKKNDIERGTFSFLNSSTHKDYSNSLNDIDSPRKMKTNNNINSSTEFNHDSFKYIYQLNNTYQSNFYPKKSNLKRPNNEIENIYIDFNSKNNNTYTNFNKNNNFSKNILNNKIKDNIFPISPNNSPCKKISEKMFSTSPPSIDHDFRKNRQNFVKFNMKKSPSDYVLHSETRGNYISGININDLIIFENKINNILSVITVINNFRDYNLINVTEECKEFLIFYFESTLKGKIISVFNIAYKVIIESSVNLFLFCIILCYHLSNNNLLDINILPFLNEILNLIKLNFLLYVKQLILKNDNEKLNKIFLNNLIKYKIIQFDKEDDVVKKIFANCRCIMTKDLNKIITLYQKNNTMYLNDFVKIFNNISLTSEKDLKNYFYKKLLNLDIVQNLRGNKNINEKYIPKRNYKEYSVRSNSNKKSVYKSKQDNNVSNLQKKSGLFSFISMVKYKKKKD